MDGECRGDGLHAPDASVCKARFLEAAWQYGQFVVLFAIILLVAGCLVWRSRRAVGGGAGGLFSSGAASAFQPIPVQTAAGDEDGQGWGWSGEQGAGAGEDHVELLGEKRKKSGIYALARSPPAAAANSYSSVPPPLPASSAGARRASDAPSTQQLGEDLFAVRCMYVCVCVVN